MLITKKFELSYAHILPNHSGKCERLHGHNAILEVTVSGEPHGAETYEGVRPPRMDEGMVIDFGDLKQIVKDAVVDKWDHRFLAKGDEWPYVKGAGNGGHEDEFVYVGIRTTAENLAKLAFNELHNRISLDPIIRCIVVSVKFYETPDSWAEYTVENYWEEPTVEVK